MPRGKGRAPAQLLLGGGQRAQSEEVGGDQFAEATVNPWLPSSQTTAPSPARRPPPTVLPLAPRSPPSLRTSWSKVGIFPPRITPTRSVGTLGPQMVGRGQLCILLRAKPASTEKRDTENVGLKRAGPGGN